MDPLFDNPRVVERAHFRRRVMALEHTDRADLQRVVAHLLADPWKGDPRPDGSYHIAFGHYVVKYSLLDDRDRGTLICLDDLRFI
jgi:hypothetical protein